MEGDGGHIGLLMKVIMRKGLNWSGLFKEKSFESAMQCGGNWKDQPSGKDLVLDHIILDLTGCAVPLEHIQDASVQRAFRRKKRLLRRSHTVLMSRLAIMALVAVMLVVTTLLTWYFTSTYSARSVKSLAWVLRQQLLRTSMRSMVSVLGEAYNATLVLSSLHQQAYFASANKSWESVELELRQINRGVFNAQNQYSSVAFVSEDGRVTDYSRSRALEYLFFVNATYGQTQIWYFQNVTGYVNESDAPPPILRLPPYPLSASNVLTMKPLEVYWSISPNIMGQPVVSPAVPARDISTDAFLGLATITTTFAYVNSYLASIDLLEGFVYFEWYNETGRSLVVAFSYNGTNDVLLSPENSSNPIVRAAAVYLASTYGYDVLSKDQTNSDNINLMGHKYYIDTMPLTKKPYNVLNMTAVMIIPRKSIMGRIDRRNRTVVGVSVGTAIGVLILGCCFICFLTSKMSTEMQLRQELIRQLVGKHRAEQSSNYKSQFLANMSHELRTPMAGIIGLLDLLSCDTLTSEQEISVSQIRHCATGLLALVNNVLDISKVEAGRMELEVAPFSITDELESLVDMFAAQSVGSDVDVALDLSDNIPLVVRGDVTRIRQIFSNLLSNSVKFTTHGHVLIRGWVDQSLLELDRKHVDFNRGILSRQDKFSGSLFMGAENRVALVFEVDDSGCGIPLELRETVFDSFVQGDSSTTRIHGGSGLGLYIVRSLVELMGGEVRVASKQGPGTLMRFHIIVERSSIPMFQRTVSNEGQPLSSPSPDGLNSLLGSPSNLFEPVRGPFPEDMGGRRVLVAMKESVAQKVAVQWLERNGLTVTCAKDWEDIIPAMEDMCKNAATELKSVRNDDLGQGEVGFISSPNVACSPESTSQVSENMLESVNFPSVLALVDVTMDPNMKIGFDSKFVEPSALVSSETSVVRPDPEKLPPNTQDLLDYMVRIHNQHSVAVSWVVSPDCGPRWKQALQADSRFLVMSKPLHGSRMRRLLALLARTGKLEQHHWEEVHSYKSSSPCTPRLQKMATSLSDGENVKSHTDFRELSGNKVWDRSERTMHAVTLSSAEDVSIGNGAQDFRGASLVDSQEHSRKLLFNRGSHLLPGDHKEERPTKDDDEVSSGVSSIGTREYSRKRGLNGQNSLYLQGVNLDVTPSTNVPLKRVLLVDIPYVANENQRLLNRGTPESPTSGLITPQGDTSGLITPEGANLTADGVEEVQRDGAECRDIEEEWSGPVIDFSLPAKVKQKRKFRPGWSAGLNDNKSGVESGHDTAAKPDVVTTSESSAAALGNALSSLHILLVEDTPLLQRLASMMLTKLGANVTVVGDGLQAVTAVAEAVEGIDGVSGDGDAIGLSNVPHFDLILMDCAMPVMDGYNATKAIRAAEVNTSRHIPIVALTAHALASDEERCLSVGMDAYLTKPINRKLMVTTIQDLVSRGRE